MKIVHVADFHGIETGNPSEIIPGKLRERGHDVEFYTSDLFKPTFDKGYPIKMFKGFKLGNKALYPGLISKLLLQENPDVIHSWVFGFFSTFVSGWLKPVKRYPLVVSTDFDYNEPKPSLSKRPYTFFYRKMPTSLADIITTFTMKEKEVMVERFKFDADKVETLPIGIDFKRFSSRPKQNLKQ